MGIAVCASGPWRSTSQTTLVEATEDRRPKQATSRSSTSLPTRGHKSGLSSHAQGDDVLASPADANLGLPQAAEHDPSLSRAQIDAAPAPMMTGGLRDMPTQPRRVGVIGAGIVGLSTAWFLRRHGCEVTVVDRDGVAAGASWGNAGWLTPSLTMPLPSPEMRSYGIRALLDNSSPLYVPLRPDVALLRFLLSFLRHSTHARWHAAMRHYVPLSRLALAAFDELFENGVEASVCEGDPFLACFRTSRERDVLLAELTRIERAGLPVHYDLVDGAGLRRIEPALAPTVDAAIQLHGQRYLDPPRFLAALARGLQRQDVEIEAPRRVDDITDDGSAVVVHTDAGVRRYDAAVLATGAWLPRIARSFGIRQPLPAGRGYSFSVPVTRAPRGPVYFPVQRIACTPLGDRLRIAGMMEFRAPDAPLDRRRTATIAATVAPLLADIDLSARQDEWVGSRPVTADGMPLIGPTRSRRVHVAGGHGMWGIVLGPITGQLLAASIVEGRLRPELAPFDPLRR